MTKYQVISKYDNPYFQGAEIWMKGRKWAKTVLDRRQGKENNYSPESSPSEESDIEMNSVLQRRKQMGQQPEAHHL